MVGQRMKQQENVSFSLKNIMPGAKTLREEHLFPLEKLLFLLLVEKKKNFSSGNKSSARSFSAPGIMFPARSLSPSKSLIKVQIKRLKG
jgi:hypothetical protein